MPSYFANKDDAQIRIVCALSYMSAGIIGLIYMLINGKNARGQFFQFHFIQSIMLGILSMLIGWAGGALGSFIGGIIGLANGGLAGTVIMIIGGIATLLNLIIACADIFGIVQCLRGRYAEVPMISKLVRSNMR